MNCDAILECYMSLNLSLTDTLRPSLKIALTEHFCKINIILISVALPQSKTPYVIKIYLVNNQQRSPKRLSDCQLYSIYI